ncbi:MAG: class I SAM-dependent methyltransferase [Anaerolineae bacterium]|nr:class I SAM-dependent methyltransferase [Anaerolineae bacterium]
MLSAGSAEAGAAIYNKWILSVYDVGVIRLSNRLAWRCPSSRMVDFYNQHISANHLDVGVGTGYFLDHCRFPAAAPRIALLDLNPNSLSVTAERLRRYRPSTHVANVLEPIRLDGATFDSIGLNYVLHCLPGTLRSKQAALRHLAALLNPGGGVFGTTILGQGIRPNFLARRLMKLYNAKGIFSNQQDNRDDLEAILKQTFRAYSTHVVGCVAFFRGTM